MTKYKNNVQLPQTPFLVFFMTEEIITERLQPIGIWDFVFSELHWIIPLNNNNICRIDLSCGTLIRENKTVSIYKDHIIKKLD